jgi:aquaporin related protein
MTLLPIRSFASRSINICMSRQKFAVATTLSADTNVARGLFIEMFLTALLVFTIFMLAAEKHRATFIAPIGIGLALFIAHLAGTRFTGGSSAICS